MSAAIDLFADFEPSPEIRPIMNVGAGLDVPTGTLVWGERGETYINGGLPYVSGVVGRGNMFKSVFSLYFVLSALNRYRRAKALEYDTETSATMGRIHMLSKHMENLAGVHLDAAGRFRLTDNTVMYGDEFWVLAKKMCQVKLDNAKAFTCTAPFRTEKKEIIQILDPTINFVDSFSMFSTKAVNDIYEKNKLGDGAANTDALRSAAHKTQMLMQVPTLTGQAAMYLMMTAHVGKQHQLDAYAPVEKKLAFLKNASLKNVPEKFTFLTNNLWYVYNSSVLANKSTKAPEYPRSSADDMEGDTDLMVILVQNLRGKNGPTGLPFEVVLSQREGVLASLTEFHMIKSNERFGLGGNDRNYFLELLPDVSLSRTTVRAKIDENYKLRRALEITSQMLQMRQLWQDPEGVFCTPKELFNDLKAMGYDWDVLLGETRGHWVFKEDEPFEEKLALSTYDLMRMRKGLYHPFWMPALSDKDAMEKFKAARAPINPADLMKIAA